FNSNPEIIPLPGLNAARQWYLFDEVRKHIQDKEKQDNLSLNIPKELPESSFKPSKTITREQLQIHRRKLPGHNSKPTEENYQRKAPSLLNEIPENSSKSGEEITRESSKPASRFPRNLPENNSKSGEENYKRKSPNPAKKLEAEAELEILSGNSSKPSEENYQRSETYQRTGEEIARESSKPGEENYQKKAQTW
ncbi:38754_t:CDS:2, partial [Gigaspora margarita]